MFPAHSCIVNKQRVHPRLHILIKSCTKYFIKAQPNKFGDRKIIFLCSHISRPGHQYLDDLRVLMELL